MTPDPSPAVMLEDPKDTHAMPWAEMPYDAAGVCVWCGTTPPYDAEGTWTLAGEYLGLTTPDPPECQPPHTGGHSWSCPWRKLVEQYAVLRRLHRFHDSGGGNQPTPVTDAEALSLRDLVITDSLQSTHRAPVELPHLPGLHPGVVAQLRFCRLTAAESAEGMFTAWIPGDRARIIYDLDPSLWPAASAYGEPRPDNVMLCFEDAPGLQLRAELYLRTDCTWELLTVAIGGRLSAVAALKRRLTTCTSSYRPAATTPREWWWHYSGYWPDPPADCPCPGHWTRDVAQPAPYTDPYVGEPTETSR